MSCFMYHKEHGAKIFTCEEAEKLGAGWFDSPAKIDNGAEKVELKPISEVVKKSRSKK